LKLLPLPKGRSFTQAYKILRRTWRR